MAFLIPSFTNPDTGAVYPNAYARIFTVKANKNQKAAIVQVDIYASQALRAALKSPVYIHQTQFLDTPATPAQFSGNFLSPTADPTTLPAPTTNETDALLSKAYLALKQHPDMAAILAAATPI
jgi:hypothetical protein